MGGLDAAAPPARDTTVDLRLDLNVPAYRLDVLEHGAVTRSIRVAVGQRKYPTALGHFRVDYVVWNPWWRPPDSYWARRERPKPPGWGNPVGRVKLHVQDLVFLHGTPHDSSLGSAASHACVRMANADAIALARLVHARAGPPLAPGLLDSLIADTGATRTIPLPRAVPVDIRYDLAEVRAGELVLYPDVYRLGGGRAADAQSGAVAALLRAGWDTAGLDRERLRERVRAARRAEVRSEVANLFAGRESQ